MGSAGTLKLNFCAAHQVPEKTRKTIKMSLLSTLSTIVYIKVLLKKILCIIFIGHKKYIYIVTPDLSCSGHIFLLSSLESRVYGEDGPNLGVLDRAHLAVLSTIP